MLSEKHQLRKEKKMYIKKEKILKTIFNKKNNFL